MDAMQWLFIVGGPILCAAAGAWPAWLFTRRHYERQLDTVYEDGWRQGRAWYPPEVAHEAAAWLGAPSEGAQLALRGPEAATQTLRALPAPDRASSGHRAPEPASLRIDDLAALARIRAMFADIREGLGLRA